MSNFINQFPYADFHEMNLDWILKEIKNLGIEISNYEAANEVNYAGSWDITKQYMKWAIVLDTGSGWMYMSKQAVPTGIDISNAEYWILISPFAVDVNFSETSYNAIANRTVTRKFNDLDEFNEAMTEKVDNEISERTEADTQINTRITLAERDLNEKIDELTEELHTEEETRETTDTEINAALTLETAERASADSMLSARIDAIASLPEGSTTGDAELIDIRTAANGYIYPAAGDAVRGQYDILEGNLEKVLTDNILYEILSETVEGAGTYVNKNIDYHGPIVSGQDYTLNIASIVGATSPHLAYLRLMDSEDQIISNVAVGSETENAHCTITATNDTAYLRITLYPATTTPLPSGSAVYNGIKLAKGTALNYEINSSIKYDRLTDDEFQIANSVHYTQGKNLFNGYTSNRADNLVINDNARLSSNEAYSSVFLSIPEDNTTVVCNYAYLKLTFYTEYSDITTMEIGDYIPNFISGVTTTTIGQVVTVPAGAKYMGVAYQSDRINSIQIEYGTTVTSYEKFYRGIPGADVIPTQPTVIKIKADGSGDYANLRLALEAAQAANQTSPYEIWIYEGTYDIASLFTAEEIAQQSNNGLFVPDYVSLIGIGNKNNIKLTCTLDNYNQYFSPLHFRNYGYMKNLTVEATKCRYVVHDDIAGNGMGGERIIDNCIFNGYDLYYECVYGSGMKEGMKWTFTNTVFNGEEAGRGNTSGLAFLGHNSLGWTKPSEITFQNCRMIREVNESSASTYAMRFRSLNSYNGLTANDMPIYVHLYGNLCNGIELREDESGNYGSGILTYVDGYNNKNAYEHITSTASPAITPEDRFDLIGSYE